MPSEQPTLPPRPHVALVRCRVQYLGRAAPLDAPDGVVALQKPLRELFAAPSPFDAVVTVYTSGIVVNQKGGGADVWWPMQDLKEAAALRPLGHPPEVFVALTSPEGQAVGPSHAPVFATIFGRHDIPVRDCWAVICQSDEAAMALYSATRMAHNNPAGWTTHGDRPPAMNRPRQAVMASSGEDWDGAVVKEGLMWGKCTQPDYYEKPPLQGFFYTPRADLIQKYEISAGSCSPCCDAPQTASAQPATSVPVTSVPATTSSVQTSVLTAANPPPPQVIQPQCVEMVGRSGGFLPPVPDFLHQVYPREIVEQQAEFVGGQRPDLVQFAPYPPGYPPMDVYPPEMSGYPVHPSQVVPVHAQPGYGYRTDVYPADGQRFAAYPQHEFVDEEDSGTRKEKKKKKKKKDGKKKSKHRSKEDDDEEDVVPDEVYLVRSRPKQTAAAAAENFERYLPDPQSSQPQCGCGDNGPPPPPQQQQQLSYSTQSVAVPRDRRPDDYVRPLSDRRYESHIAPGGVNYASIARPADPYADEGPYERRLPTAGSMLGYTQQQQQPQQQKLVVDPMDPAGAQMMNGNFILRRSDDYRVRR